MREIFAGIVRDRAGWRARVKRTWKRDIDVCRGSNTSIHSFNKYLVPILMTAVETAENKTVTVAPSWKL